MHGKYYNRKANNSKGILPSQMGTIRKSIYKLNPETLAHMIREQEKRTSNIIPDNLVMLKNWLHF
jgi:hypothetical protein